MKPVNLMLKIYDLGFPISDLWKVPDSNKRDEPCLNHPPSTMLSFSTETADET